MASKTGAVAKLWEKEFTAFAEVVEPASDGYGLAFVLADIGDRADGHKIRSEVRGQIDEVKPVGLAFGVNLYNLTSHL